MRCVTLGKILTFLPKSSLTKGKYKRLNWIISESPFGTYIVYSIHLPRFITSLKSTYSLVRLSIHPINIYYDLLHTTGTVVDNWDGLVKEIKIPDFKADVIIVG